MSDRLYSLMDKNINSIRQETFESDFYFNESSIPPNFNQEVLAFKECNFENFYLNLHKNSKLKRIVFNNCQFSEKLEINDTIDVKISFLKECNMNNFEAYSCSNCVFLLRNMIIQNVNFVNLKGAEIKSYDSIVNVFSLNGCTESSIDFGGKQNSINELIISSSEISSFRVKSATIKKLEAYHNNFAIFEIGGIRSEIIFGSFDLSNCIFKGFDINKTVFNELFNMKSNRLESPSIISNSVFDGRASFLNHDLANVTLDNLNFNNSKLSFESSKIYSAKFSAIQWPKDYDLVNFRTKNDPKDQFYRRSLSEQYRQLKISHDKNGDKISMLNFYAKEMKEVLRISQMDKNMNSYDRFLLWTNRKFSNFGLSYTLPLKWLFLFHTIFFTLLVLLGYDGLSFVWPWNNLGGIVESLGYYFYLLNPLHKLVDTSNGWILFADFFMRVVSSYFIFYFLKATRNFTA